MIRYPDHSFDVADVLATSNIDTEPRFNLGRWDGESADNVGIGAESPVWFHYGFASRPADPTGASADLGAGACMALYLVDGDQKRVLATRDNRFGGLLAALKPGESIQHGPKGNFIRCRDDGSIMIYTTTDGTTDGRGVYLSVGQDGFEMSCPWGRFTMGPLGIHFLHSSGARLDLGAIGGLPGPLASLGSYATLEGGVASIKGGAVALGTDAGLGNETAVLALKALIDAIGLALTTFVAPPGGGPCTNLNLAAVAPLLTTFNGIASAIGKVV